MAKSPLARRADLKAALKRFKKGEHISLEDLARLWGVVKARFVSVRNDIVDFPDPIGKDGNAYIYDARAAIEALLRHESRNDRLIAKSSSKVRRILGASAADEEAPLPPAEMLSLARAGVERTKWLRDQGLLVKFSDVQEVANEVFGEVSAFLSKLSETIDPNGKLPASIRSLVDTAGKDALLRIYGRLNDMLPSDADVHAPRAAKNRAGPDRPRRAKVRPGPKTGVRKRA